MNILQLSGQAPWVPRLCLLLIPPHFLEYIPACPRVGGEIKTRKRRPSPQLHDPDSNVNTKTVFGLMSPGSLLLLRCRWNFEEPKPSFSNTSLFLSLLLCWHFHKGQGLHVRQWNKWQLTAPAPGHRRIAAKTLLTDVWNISHRQERKWKMTPLASHRIHSPLLQRKNDSPITGRRIWKRRKRSGIG